MIIVGSWNKYPLQVIVAVIGIVITLAYLFRMMRGLFYGPMDQKYSHSHDAVAVVDRVPLLIMIVVSIGFGLFPMHMYNVVRSGVDPLVAKITLVHPVSAGTPSSQDLLSSATEASRASTGPAGRRQ
jgi:NADH-quinone oxidoreductase subunit M